LQAAFWDNARAISVTRIALVTIARRALVCFLTLSARNEAR
jgi:hypothetical protein